MKAWLILLLLSASLLLMPPLGARGAAGPATAFRFFGGAGDGFTHSAATNYTRPEGGELTRYTGGPFDGAASQRLYTYNIPAPGELGRYLGGAFDGADSGGLAGFTPALPGALSRFVGGDHDGHADLQVHNLGNPLSGDSDHDGVPDWWEAYRYQSTTLADRLADLDGDGESSLNEYLADTDPLDALSRFHLSATGTAPSLTCTAHQTSAERVYALEYSTTLEPGSWVTIGGSSQPGNGGDLAFPATDDYGDNGYFRAVVSLPE